MEGSEFSSLLCQEDETCLINQVEDDEESEDSAIGFYPFFVSENEDEYVENLFLKESYCFASKGFVPFSHCSATTWFKAARLDSIDWIFNACSSSESLFLVFDSFLPFPIVLCFNSVSESYVDLLF